jgi:hypothetical protein
MRRLTIPFLVGVALMTVGCGDEGMMSSVQPVTMHVDLVEQVGADATVDIVDHSSTLTGASSVDPGDGASVPDGAIETASLSADPNTIVLTWSGMPCDTVHGLTIGSDGVSMRLERQRCEGDAIGVDHVLLLTFDHAVDVTTVNPVLRTTD